MNDEPVAVECEVLSIYIENTPIDGQEKLNQFFDVSVYSKNILTYVLEKEGQRRYKFVHTDEVAEFIVEELVFYKLIEVKPKKRDKKQRSVLLLTPKGRQMAEQLLEAEMTRRSNPRLTGKGCEDAEPDEPVTIPAEFFDCGMKRA